MLKKTPVPESYLGLFHFLKRKFVTTFSLLEIERNLLKKEEVYNLRYGSRHAKGSISNNLKGEEVYRL